MISVFARIAIACLLILAGCAPAPRPEQPKPDPAKEAGYSEAVKQLAALNREAEALLEKGHLEEAAAAITKGVPLQARLLTAPRPPLEAMEAISDLDDLYARMLLRNGRPGWARLMYQKNAARWKSWRPQTPDSARRLRQANAGLAECDRRLVP